MAKSFKVTDLEKQIWLYNTDDDAATLTLIITKKATHQEKLERSFYLWRIYVQNSRSEN